MPTAEQFAAMSAAAHSTASCSMQSTGSYSNLGLFNVVKKYKRAKALLQVCRVLLSRTQDCFC